MEREEIRGPGDWRALRISAIPGNKIWIILGNCSQFLFCCIAFAQFLIAYSHNMIVILSLPCTPAVTSLAWIALFNSFRDGKDVTPHVLGRSALCLHQLLSIGAAMLLRALLLYNYTLIILLVLYTLYLRSLLRLRYNVLDLKIGDAVLVVFMQFGVYFTLFRNIYIFGGVLVFCELVIFYQICAYKVPDHDIYTNNNNNGSSRLKSFFGGLVEFFVSGHPVGDLLEVNDATETAPDAIRNQIVEQV